MKVLWLASLLVLFVARTVQAAEPLSVSPTDPFGVSTADPRSIARAESHTSERCDWYGWQTLVVDGASLALGTAAIGLSGSSSSGSEVGNVAGVLTVSALVLGGPIVHAAHGNWEKAGGSLGLRLGAPAAGALGGFLVGSASCPHDDSDVPCSAVGGGIGLIAGAATAIIVDVAVLANEPEPKAPLSIRFAPIVIAERNRWGAGFSGTF